MTNDELIRAIQAVAELYETTGYAGVGTLGKALCEVAVVRSRSVGLPQMIDDYEEAEKIAARVITADAMSESLARLDRGVAVLREWAQSGDALDRPFNCVSAIMRAMDPEPPITDGRDG